MQNAHPSSDIRDTTEKVRFFLVAEFSKEARVSSRTVLKWIRCKKLRTLPNCRPYRIPLSELKRLESGVLQ